MFCLFMLMGALGKVSPDDDTLAIDTVPRSIVSSVAALQNVSGNVGGTLVTGYFMAGPAISESRWR